MSLNTFGWSSHLTPARCSELSANADQRVIVLLRDQHTALAGRTAEAQRAHAFAADRGPDRRAVPATARAAHRDLPTRERRRDDRLRGRGRQPPPVTRPFSPSTRTR